MSRVTTVVGAPLGVAVSAFVALADPHAVLAAGRSDSPKIGIECTKARDLLTAALANGKSVEAIRGPLHYLFYGKDAVEFASAETKQHNVGELGLRWEAPTPRYPKVVPIYTQLAPTSTLLKLLVAGTGTCHRDAASTHFTATDVWRTSFVQVLVRRQWFHLSDLAKIGCAGNPGVLKRGYPKCPPDYYFDSPIIWAK